SALNPIRNPTRAKARRNVVLGRLLTENYITQEEYNEATSQPITAYFHGAEINLYAPYISEMVRAEMVSRYGIDKAYNSGFKIFTSVESKVQKAAQNALVNNLHNYDMRHGFRGPTDVLWAPETQPALTEQQILNKLQSVNELGTLKAAAVLSVNDKTASVLLKSGERTTLTWDNLKWARKYITRYRQSFAPKAATDILTPGMQIWVRKNEDDSYLLSQIPEASSAIVSLDPQDGRIKAIVGGYSFEQSQYNRAVQAKRQVGSNIKPFIYSAALEKGYTLASILNDAPINQWDKSQGVAWRPKNSPAVYNGPIRIRRALAQSKNVISVRLLRGVGLQRTADHLLKFGFKDSDINRSESLALGSASITPLELARGMSAFANGGHLIEPYFISEIQDAYGNVLFKANPALACDEESLPTHNEFSLHNSSDEVKPTKKCAPRIISKQNAFLIADAMHSGIWGGGSWAHKTGWSGTGWRAQALERRDLSGKTGTTNDSVDTWFSGFNSKVMTSVWVGFDNPGNALGRSTYNNNLDSSQISGAESGAKTAQPAWIEFMKAALEGTPEAPIEPPEGLVSIRIDLATGLLSHKNDYTSRFEYFEKGTAPTKYVLSQPNDIFEEDTKTEEELF
ncbi:penicillin-binding protein 1A, partial [Pseudoalteromonas sp. SR45-5]|uniref:penicillin-binding protein 1A n=1 Tax=Pseudoalteromonas sp. SR45-5 TaxID=2760928 RepID=UPI0015FD7A55